MWLRLVVAAVCMVAGVAVVVGAGSPDTTTPAEPGAADRYSEAELREFQTLMDDEVARTEPSAPRSNLDLDSNEVTFQVTSELDVASLLLLGDQFAAAHGHSRSPLRIESASAE